MLLLHLGRRTDPFHVLFEHCIMRRSILFTNHEAPDDQGAGFRGRDNDATIVDSSH